jgi:hypothetical protein
LFREGSLQTTGLELGVVVHIHNRSSQDSKVGGLLSSDQPGLHSEALSQTKQNKTNRFRGWEYSLLVECLSGMDETLSSISSSGKKSKNQPDLALSLISSHQSGCGKLIKCMF